MKPILLSSPLPSSLDSRRRGLVKGAHWAGEALAGRASLSVGVGGRTRSGLVLEHLTKEDLGEYRCRVDFLESPTRNARVQLDIIGEAANLGLWGEAAQGTTRQAVSRRGMEGTGNRAQIY